MDKKTAIEITEKLLTKSNIKYTNSQKKPNTPNNEIENLKKILISTNIFFLVFTIIIFKEVYKL